MYRVLEITDTFRSLCPVDVYVVPDVVIHVIGFGYCLLRTDDIYILYRYYLYLWSIV